MRYDPKTDYDGIQVITGGMNSGDAPNIIGRQTLADAVNVTNRGGFPMTRPAWVKRPLVFANPETVTPFTTGKFQGAGKFQTRQGHNFLICSISGRIYTISIDPTYTVTDVTISGDVNDSTGEKTWFSQAEDWAIITNGRNVNQFWDGVTLRRALPDVELPVARATAYIMGRVWGVDPQGRSFWAGDLCGGSSGTSPYLRRDAVLKFTENAILNGGGRFNVPFDAGEITAIATYAQIDTSLGQGPVIVLTHKGAFSVQAPFDRTTWANLQFPIQTVSSISEGATSQEAVVQVNGDLWYRSIDGVRSYATSRRDVGVWTNTPLSFEVSNVIEADDENLLGFCSGAVFDNYLFQTCSPYRVFGRGVLWRGMEAMDFSQVSSIGSQGENPVWDGLWTGLNMFQLVVCDERLFAFTLSKTGTIDLWEMDINAIDDDNSVPITSHVDTSAMNFQGGWNMRELGYGAAWFDKMEENISFQTWWWSDQYPNPIPWHNWSESVLNSNCNVSCTQPPRNYAAQFRGPMRLPMPSDTCDPINTKRNLRRAYEFQTRIAWTGRARLKKFLIAAREVQEDVVGECRVNQAADTEGITSCGQPFGYSSEP